MDYFIYNGIDSRDFGLSVINDGIRKSSLLPPKETHTVSIAGNDGELITEQSFKQKDIKLRVLLSDNTVSNKRKIVQWLSKTKQGQLILSYESNKVYVAVFDNQIKIDNYLNGGIFDINFKIYNPIAKSRLKTITNPSILYNAENIYGTGLIYGLSPIDYTFSGITTTTDLEIYNGSTVDGSLPVITVTGSADDISITHFTDSTMTDNVSVIEYGSFTGELKIDCELGQCFLNSNLNNNTHNSEFIKLIGKTNTQSLFSGDVIDIGNGYAELTTNSISNINNCVDNVIFIRYDDNIIYRKIVSCDEINNVVYFSDIDIEELNYDVLQYTIYDIADGLNYIRIDGTNLNITEIDFDFNFLYL